MFFPAFHTSFSNFRIVMAAKIRFNTKVNRTLMKTMPVLVLFAALCLTTVSNAQLTVNPKVGINVSGVEAKIGDLTTEARVGWNAGIDLRFGDKMIFFNPGIQLNNYTARLVKDLEEQPDVKLREETTIQALKAPINLGLRLTGTGGLMQIYAKGGVTPTMLLSVQEKDNFPFNKDDLKKITWGANAGVGVDVLFLTVDLNYEIGLTDYFANAPGKNNVLTLSAGIKF